MTAPKFLGLFEVGSPEWHEQRVNGVAGSEVAMILGLSPYGGQFKLWHIKTGLYDADDISSEMEAGTRLEPVIVAKFADMHPEFAVKDKAGTWCHGDRPWMVANPDALVYRRSASGRRVGKPVGLLETKFALYPDHFGEPGTDEVPIWYRCQVQWYLDVLGLDVAYLMVFIGSTGEFREYVIRADQLDQATLRKAAASFLRKVRSGERPPIDGHDTTYEVIKALNPGIEPRTVEVSERVAREFVLAKAAEKAAAERAKAATATLADVMGTAHYATYQQQRLADRRSKGGGVPYVQAAKVLPVFTTEMETKAS